MDDRVAILVSQGPVDGYPPVQHQARLLADAGYLVELITVPLPGSDSVVVFNHTGVRVTQLPVRVGRGLQTVSRTLDFVVALSKARLRWAQSNVVEIAFDPVGMLYSDLAVRRPKHRIAHFHETLQRIETDKVERRLAKAISGFQCVVVPDKTRAEILRDQLNLPEMPLVVPNYPLQPKDKACTRQRRDSNTFEVVYCGSLGLKQKLDFVIESVSLWPDGARFSIIGNDLTATGERLKDQVRRLNVADRVRFEGWIDFTQLEERLSRADLGILLFDDSFEQWRTALGASNKRYQYMQAGLAQIGDFNPGVLELLEGQGIGRCLRAHSVEELASVVAFYMSRRELCAQEGGRARELHVETYNYQRAFEPVLAWLGAHVPDAGGAQGVQ